MQGAGRLCYSARIVARAQCRPGAGVESREIVERNMFRRLYSVQQAYFLHALTDQY